MPKLKTKKNTAIKLKAKPLVSKYIVTAAQKGAPVDSDFMDSLDQYAAQVGAQILITPLDGIDVDDVLHPKLAANPAYIIVEDDMNLNTRLSITQFHVKPTQRNPMSGLEDYVGTKNSTIVGSTKQHMLPKANSNHSLPKILMSTGACTQPYYKENKIGKVATEEHKIGALYVEVTEDHFQFRQIQSIGDGSFIDLGVKFDGRGQPQTVRAEALVLGDIHTGQICKTVMGKTAELMALLQPRYLVLHDLFDGQSVNHHEEEHYINRSRTYERGDLNAELIACGDVLKWLLSKGPADMQIVVVKSNHDEFLTRYLQAGKFANDPRNLFISSTLAAMISRPNEAPKTPTIESNGVVIPTSMLRAPVAPVPDALEEGIKLATGQAVLERTRFLKRTDDFKLRGWQLGSHGDHGANGKKISGYSEIMRCVGKSITGHKHSPGIFREAFVVGTSTELDLDYNAGAPSSWMNTHAVLYPNGKAQLVNIIEGDYKL